MDTNIKTQEKVSTKSVHVYPSEKPNCGIIPDKEGLIYQFGETQEFYPPKYIKVLVKDKLDNTEIAKALRKLADVLDGTTELKYEDWVNELQLKNS